MAEYTYKDIIVDPEDPRAKDAIGKDVYFGLVPSVVLKYANTGGTTYKLLGIRKNSEGFRFIIASPPMSSLIYYDCIIIKQEEVENG